MGRRPAHRLGLDAGDVLRPRGARRRRSGCARTTSGCGQSSSAAASAASRAPASRRSPQPSWRAITGRPVRLVNDRHAEQLDGGRRGATRQTDPPRRDAATARSPRSRPTRWSRWARAAGRCPSLIPARTLYRCADVRAMTFPAKTNLRAQNAFRAPGVMEGTAVFEQAIDELALALGHGSARAAAPQPRRRRPGQRAAVLEQAAARLLRPRGRARGLGRSASALREPQRRRPPPRHGLRDADLVGRRRPAVARDGAPRRRGPRARRHGHPGHRHRHADGRADRRGGGARAPARARPRHRRRHRPERLRAGGGRLADDAVGDARRPLGLGEGAQDAAPAGRRRLRDRRRATSRSATAGSARTTARSTPP